MPGLDLYRFAALLGESLAQAVLAALAVYLTTRSARWRRGPELVEDTGTPSLRALAWITPAALFAQVILGAFYRQRFLGVIPHVVWALVAAMIAVIAASFVLGQYPRHGALRPVSWWLIGLTSGQVLLGVLALWARVADGPAWLRWAHIGTGALVLSAAAVLSAQILRNVRTVRARGRELMGSGRIS